MKIVIRAEDIKKHQVLMSKFGSGFKETMRSDKYITLCFNSEMIKDFILPLIERKVPYLFINDNI